MKARKKGSNDEWENVAFVQLEGSDILFKKQYLEFQYDESPTEFKTYDQVNTEQHWQDVRERAAIAALQGMYANQRLYGKAEDYARRSVKIANALVEQLKRE